ncbi:hypothetical protein SprV_0100357700 [Sparganum proliferum]
MDAENAGESCSGCQVLAVKVKYLEEEITKMKAQLQCSLDQTNATNMPTGRVTRSRAKAPSSTPAPITAAPERIAKKRENNDQKGNPKTEEKKKSNCKKAEENGRLLPEDASLAAETETLTDVPSLMANAACPNTFAESQKQSELDRPSTSGGIDSSVTATGFSPQSSLPSASSKVVNIRVKRTDGVSASAPPSPARSPRALRHLGNHNSVENKKEADREKCLIIQGLPESSANSPKERVSEDLSLSQGLLNNILEPTEAIEVSKAFRLGKRADNSSVSIRLRPLKVVLASSDQASLIYSRRFRIKGSNPETWLTQHVDDRELALPGYQMFRRDKEGRQGGGVLTYVKNGLNVSDKTDNFSCGSEAIWLSVKVPSSPSLDVLTVYRPPRWDNMTDARLLEELEKFATRPDILIMGDFNAPHIDWSSTHANSSEQTFDMSFLNTALELFLTQHVMLPTRVREGQQANCHDLVLTKSQDSIDEVSCLPPPLSSETGFNPSALQSFEDTPIIETVQFTEGMVLTELLKLKESKSPGPDEIPAKILKELAGELSKSLSMLFHTSFETGYLPPDWKSAWITPLYKGGSRVSANNYRPVSLTSICCKIMEKIIKQQLMQFLEQNQLLSDSQHGFRKSRSCVTNLLYCLELWTRAVDRGDMVHVIYIDFKKAFDSVPHHRLLYILSRAGVRGKFLMWIRSFLIGRSQAVHVSDQQSAEVSVRSGVPQGSVLGPTLFLVYVNDCANELNCDVAMFADDIKIWSTIRSEVDEARLQTNLDHLEQWSKDWLLPFNVNKCNFLRVGRTSYPNHTVYRLTGKPLQEVDAQKDLGVWITTSLKPWLQCSKAAKSAMSILYLVKRAFSSFDEECSAKVFQTFLRPHLEFAIQAWRPWTAKDFGILKKVQRRATKLVSGQWSLRYETRLANLALFPLSYRQLRGNLIQAFRIVRNQGCCLASGDFFELATTTNLRGHPLKLRVPGARLDTRKFFSNRVVTAWNALPGDVVVSGSVDTFKRRLNHLWDANHNNGSLPPP